MKHLFLLLAALLLLLATIFLDHSTLGWALERPLVEVLAKKTRHPLPQVTAVILPLNDGVLAPQDVALTLRACLSFHPRKIIIEGPIGDYSNGPFSLLREGMEKGVLQDIPFCYELSSHLAFSNLMKASPRLLALDDFLLKREEMERGDIRPDLDVFFRDQIVIIGGPNVIAQAEYMQSEQERFAVNLLKITSYGLLLFVIVLGVVFLTSLTLIDFVLALFFFGIGYLATTVWLFHAQGILLPLFLPLVFVFISVGARQDFLLKRSCSSKQER